MPDLSALCDLVPHLLPIECLQARFMQQALLGLLLLAPVTAVMGVQVVNLRMAFFADAISHSAFTGVALGLLLALDPHLTMPVFAIAVGVAIMAVHRGSTLSADTVIGVFFAAAVAFGLAVVSRDRQVARDLQRFLYGDILTIGDGDVWRFAGLAVVVMGFEIFSYNRLLYIGLNPALAAAHRVRVRAYQYTFVALLSLVVIFAVWAIGVLLVTALLIVPAAAARTLGRSAGGQFWWALLVSITSAVAGLVISAQSWARTATGPTVVLVACGWFVVATGVAALRGRGPR